MLRFRGAPFDGEYALILPRAVHRKTVGASHGRLLDAWQSAGPPQDFLIKRRTLLGHSICVFGRIVREGQPDFGRYEPMGLESWAHLKQIPEASQQQASADEEHEGQG